jgi:hypothetical protein
VLYVAEDREQRSLVSGPADQCLTTEAGWVHFLATTLTGADIQVPFHHITHTKSPGDGSLKLIHPNPNSKKGGTHESRTTKEGDSMVMEVPLTEAQQVLLEIIR